MFTIPFPKKVVIPTESSIGLGRRLPCCSTSQCVIVVKQEIRAEGPSLKSLTKTWRKVSEKCSGQTVPWEKKSRWEEVDPRKENCFSTLFLKTGTSCLFLWCVCVSELVSEFHSCPLALRYGHSRKEPCNRFLWEHLLFRRGGRL